MSQKKLEKIVIKLEKDSHLVSKASWINNNLVFYENIDLKEYMAKADPAYAKSHAEKIKKFQQENILFRVFCHELSHWISKINSKKHAPWTLEFKRFVNKLSDKLLNKIVFQNKPASLNKEFIKVLKKDYQKSWLLISKKMNSMSQLGGYYSYYLPKPKQFKKPQKHLKRFEECFVEICCVAMGGQGAIEREKIEQWFPNAIQWMQDNILAQYK